MSASPFLPSFHYIAGVCTSVMGNNKLLSSEIIAQIVAQHKTAHPTREIIELVGVSSTTVKKWMLEFKVSGCHDIHV